MEDIFVVESFIFEFLSLGKVEVSLERFCKYLL